MDSCSGGTDEKINPDSFSIVNYFTMEYFYFYPKFINGSNIPIFIIYNYISIY